VLSFGVAAEAKCEMKINEVEPMRSNKKSILNSMKVFFVTVELDEREGLKDYVLYMKFHHI
jgi:hypothetical protein